MKPGNHNNGLNRRELLRGGALAAAGLTVLGPGRILAAKEDSAKTSLNKPHAPLSGKGKARAVIQIWMWGGPSHIDTFDPKPDAGYDYTGPLKDSIKTNVSGISINASLPLLAQHADKYAIIRSMTHGINAHETASYRVQTGHEPGRLVYPCTGAVVSTFKGYAGGYKGVVPPYIVLTEPQGRFSEAGFLGPKFKPFATGGDPNKDPFVVEGIVAKGISDQRQQERRKLLRELDTLGSALQGDKTFEQMDDCEQEAYALMFGEAKALFNLSGETAEMREKYGRNTFGQSCLTARRLVEYGVPYITINYKGWDTHKQHFEIMGRKLPELDQGMSALLTDLSERGLLDSTIVWWGGEFGRGPRVQWEAPWNGGRSHYGRCFTSVVAGGGFKGGTVVGASTDNATEVKDRPVYPEDLIGSMYELLGINPDGKLPNERGLDVTVMPKSKEGEGRLYEIM